MNIIKTKVKKNQKVNITKTYLCKNCGCDLKSKSKCKTKLCLKCYVAARKNPNRPSKEQLLEELKTNSYCAVGRKYGVSDNAIRKWLKTCY